MRALGPRADKPLVAAASRELETTDSASPDGVTNGADLRLQLVAEASDGYDMAGIGRVLLDFGPEPSDVDIDESTVAEISVTPHSLKEDLPAEDSPRVRTEFDE